eukprot:c56899_g1_i1 orf=73-240(+)
MTEWRESFIAKTYFLLVWNGCKDGKVNSYPSGKNNNFLFVLGSSILNILIKYRPG